MLLAACAPCHAIGAALLCVRPIGEDGELAVTTLLVIANLRGHAAAVRDGLVLNPPSGFRLCGLIVVAIRQLLKSSDQFAHVAGCMIIRHPDPIVQEGETVRATEVGKLAEMLGFSLLVTDYGVAVGDRPGQALRDTVGKDLCLPVSQVHQFVLLAIRRRGDALLDITGVRCVITVARLELVAVAVGVALADDLGLLAIDDGSDILTEVIADFDQLVRLLSAQ